MKISDYPYEKQLDKIHEWIRSADQKISISFAIINGVAIAFIIPVFKIVINHPVYLSNFLFTIFLAEILTFIAIAEYCSLSALFPRISFDSSPDSLIYFGSISNKSKTDFLKQIKATKQNNLADDYINQIIISSKISTVKHSQLKNSMQAFMACLILMSLFVIITFNLVTVG